VAPVEFFKVDFTKELVGVSVNIEPGISVSIVSGYRLDDWVIEVQSLAEVKGFYL
jgi:hypothetical protein